METRRSNYVGDILSYWCALELFAPRNWDKKSNNIISLDGIENVPQDGALRQGNDRLPWQKVTANLRIGIVEDIGKSWKSRYEILATTNIFSLTTDMNGRLQTPFSYTKSIFKWLNSVSHDTKNHINLQKLAGKQSKRWLELTGNLDELPEGALLSDHLVMILLKTGEELIQSLSLKGGIEGIYQKNYNTKYVKNPRCNLIRLKDYGKGNTENQASLKRTTFWLRHEHFIVETGLDQQKVNNALYKAAEMVRSLSDVEQAGQAEFLESWKNRRKKVGKNQNDIACLFSFVVKDTGGLEPNSLKISQYAKAVACLFAHDRWPECPAGWPHVEQYDRAVEQLQYYFNQLVLPTENNGFQRFVQKESISEIIKKVIFALELNDDILENSPLFDKQDGSPVVMDHIKYELVSNAETTTYLMDSFYLRDLERMYYSGQSSLSGPARMYLSQTHPERVDLSKDKDGVLLDECTKPDRIPSGRWPSANNLLQSLGQQLAINEIAVRAQVDSGNNLLGVNGPPGTGKTTLLKDVISQIIIERAKKLCTFESPKDIFQKKQYVRATDSFKALPYWELNPDVTGYEIIVASNNNKAVENISKELPAYDAISKEWQDYIQQNCDNKPARFAFREIADEIANGSDKHDEESDKSDSKAISTWALLAAVLGKKSNRQAFAKPFNKSFVQDLLRKVKSSKDGWSKAKEAFNCALEEENYLREKQEQKFKLYHDGEYLYSKKEKLIETLQKIQEIQQEARIYNDQKRESIRRIESELSEAHRLVGEAKKEWVQDEYAYLANAEYWKQHKIRGFFMTKSRHEKEMQLFIQKTVSLQKMERQNSEIQAMKSYIKQMWCEIQANEQWLKVKENDKNNLLQEIKDTEKKISEYEQMAAQTTKLGDDHVKLVDEKWNQARAKVMIAALALHQELVMGAAQEFYDNLNLFCNVLTSSEYKASERLISWQSFFLVVPVISTSFASVSSMFAGIGREALGWAIIDEAGQATPQSAAGLLQRVQHAVSVGDPMQLEPVDTMPVQMRELLAHTHNIKLEQEVNNVQAKVDYQTEYGMEDSRTGNWIGMPLVVHRRCDEPMFSIVNEIAYSGRMVRVGPEHRECKYTEGSKTGFELPASCWCEVSKNAWNDGSRPLSASEEQQLRGRLKDLLEGGIAPESILAISPFSEVSKEVHSVFSSVLTECLGYATRKASSVADKQAGTVHTSQGREADVVFLVLGSKSEGSRRWVNAKPNLLNVAVSRAKRRLYVIGSSEDWKGYSYTGKIYKTLSGSNEEITEKQPNGLT